MAATKDCPAEISTDIDSLFEWKKVFQDLKTPDKIVRAIVKFDPSFVLVLENVLETHLNTLSQKVQENIKSAALACDGFDVLSDLKSLDLKIPSTLDDMYKHAEYLCNKIEDFYSSVRWYLKAAQQGHLQSQLKLVWLYYSGTCGARQDKKQAYEWLYKAVIYMRDKYMKKILVGPEASLEEMCRCIHSLEYPTERDETIYFLPLVFQHEKAAQTWLRDKISKKEGTYFKEMYILYHLMDDDDNERKYLLFDAVQLGSGFAMSDIGYNYRHGTNGYEYNIEKGCRIY